MWRLQIHRRSRHHRTELQYVNTRYRRRRRGHHHHHHHLSVSIPVSYTHLRAHET